MLFHSMMFSTKEKKEKKSHTDALDQGIQDYNYVVLLLYRLRPSHVVNLEPIRSG